MTIQELKARVEWGNGDRIERRDIVAYLETLDARVVALEEGEEEPIEEPPAEPPAGPVAEPIVVTDALVVTVIDHTGTPNGSMTVANGTTVGELLAAIEAAEGVTFDADNPVVATDMGLNKNGTPEALVLTDWMFIVNYNAGQQRVYTITVAQA
jgi:hypothetical protein